MKKVIDTLISIISFLIIAQVLTTHLFSPKGLIYPINITVTSRIELDLLNNPPFRPLFSITIFNDGPDEVYFSINEPQKITPIKPHEHLKIEFRQPKIVKLFFEVDTGKTANVRGFGVY
jgi:hypothetical protein